MKKWRNKVKTLILENDYQDAIVGWEKNKKFPHRSHFSESQMICDSAKVFTPHGGVCAVYIRDGLPQSLYEAAFDGWKSIKELPINRPAAVGVHSLLRVNKDKTLGKFSVVGGPVREELMERGTAYGLLGYRMTASGQSCERTPLSKKCPQMLDSNRSLIELVNKFHKQQARSFYDMQRFEVKKATVGRLWHTIYTTIYLARNFRTAYHFDRENLLGAMTALIAMGDFEGGELVLPRWRIAFTLRPGDLLFFNPQQLHGNLPIKGERVSAAFYCLKNIANCTK
jgi:hypothetical protein